MTTMDQPVDLVDFVARAFTQYCDDDPSLMPELVERVTPLLWQVARGQSLSASAAEDVVQQSWLRLIEQADRITDPRAVLKWLMTTTRREAWRVSQRAPREALVTDLPEPGITESDDVLARVLDAADQDVLWRHVRELSERCRYLLRVIAFADKPNYATIAASLGMPVGSIGPTRGRCLATLRAALAADPAFDLGGTR